MSTGKGVLIAGVTCAVIAGASSAYAAESAVQVASIEKLGATIKKILVNDGKLMIDAGIIAAGGYAAVITNSPIAPYSFCCFCFYFPYSACCLCKLSFYLFQMTRICNLIDAEPKIMGFAVSEIVCSALLMVIGFAFDMLFFSIIALFSSVFIMRYIKYLLKKVVF